MVPRNGLSQEQWDQLQQQFINRLKAAGLDEASLARSCWWCRDTSQCDETCAAPKNFVEQ